MAKTYKDKQGSKSGRSQEHKGRHDDPDMELDLAMQKKDKNKNRKGIKHREDGRSES